MTPGHEVVRTETRVAMHKVVTKLHANAIQHTFLPSPSCHERFPSDTPQTGTKKPKVTHAFLDFFFLDATGKPPVCIAVGMGIFTKSPSHGNPSQWQHSHGMGVEPARLRPWKLRVKPAGHGLTSGGGAVEKMYWGATAGVGLNSATYKESS